jgi:hypothetical protein
MNNVKKAFFGFSITIVSIFGCNLNENKISEEKSVNAKFLSSLQKKDYKDASQYFGRKIFVNNTEEQVIDIFRHMEDTFGVLTKFELKQTKTTLDTETGEKTLGSRRYSYLVHFTKIDSLYLTLVYDTEKGGKSEDELLKIDFFTIDEYPRTDN